MTSLIKFVRNIQSMNTVVEILWKLWSPAIGSGSKLWPRGGIGRHKGGPINGQSPLIGNG